MNNRILFVTLCVLLSPVQVFAQTPAPENAPAQDIGAVVNSVTENTATEQNTNPPNADAKVIDSAATPPLDPNAPYNLKNFPSLFFTYWQHQAILEAKESRGGHVRPTSQAELDAMMKNGEELMQKPEPGIREIALGGILYKGNNNWTIWMNGQRITPSALPKEILDLQVFKDYIEVKWLDEFTGQIFPIRLRAHERFNLDMRIFLSGQ